MKKENRINEINYNQEGCLMKIIEYNGFKDVIVEFQDEYHFQVHIRYNYFRDGTVKNNYHKDVLGVGITGSKPKYINNKLTKEYRTWFDMLQRCYDLDFQDKHPTYKTCICCKEWLLYDNFYEWLHSQENFNQWINEPRSALDKDILIKGNKLYSPDNCCLVTHKINILFTKRDSKRGDLPIGVSKHNEKYRAQFSINGEHITFPVRINFNDCFYLDYKPYKEQYIKQIAKEEYDKGNITKRCYDAMMSYEVEITD
jgi:hypothetical protein